jgi:hypothetical protein
MAGLLEPLDPPGAAKAGVSQTSKSLLSMAMRRRPKQKAPGVDGSHSGWQASRINKRSGSTPNLKRR